MYTIMVTGSRAWREPGLIAEQVERHALGHAPVRVIHGGNPRGADAQAAQAAVDLGLEVREFRPRSWTSSDLLARNREMIENRPDVVLAFLTAGSRGTWYTAHRAVAAGLRVVLIGEAVSEDDAQVCRDAGALIAKERYSGPSRQALWVSLAQVNAGDRVPWLVSAARDINSDRPRTVRT